MPWPVVGGVEHATLKIATTMDPNRFSHTVFCRPDAPEVRELFRLRGIEVATFQPVEPSYRHPRAYLRATMALARELRRRKIDLVDCQEYLAAHYTALAGRLAGVPVVATIRNRFEHLPFRNRTFLWPVSHYSFVSRDTWAKFGHRVPPHRGSVVYVGIEIADYDPELCRQAQQEVRSELGIPPERRIVGMVSRVADQKDHPTFVRAAARLAARRQDVHFLVVGQHSTNPEMTRYYEELRALVRSHSLDPLFTFTGYRSDTLRIFRALDVFALSTHLEGLPIVILEAMAQCRPVVATAVDGIPEAIIDGRTGLLCGHQDDAGLTARIEKLLDDHELAARLGLQAREYCLAHFDSKQYADGVAAVYDRVLGSARN